MNNIIKYSLVYETNTIINGHSINELKYINNINYYYLDDLVNNVLLSIKENILSILDLKKIEEIYINIHEKTTNEIVIKISESHYFNDDKMYPNLYYK